MIQKQRVLLYAPLMESCSHLPPVIKAYVFYKLRLQLMSTSISEDTGFCFLTLI